MSQEETNDFPLSKTKSVRGSRRLAREKVLQVLLSNLVSETAWQNLFSHIFFRKFNFGDLEEIPNKKLLTEAEVTEIEADIPINWEDDEIIFARELIKRVIENKDSSDQMIKEFAANWEIERMAKIDKLLMHFAIQQFLHFPDIPIKVSINEVIEIGKKYSTRKSGIFINGILDNIRKELMKKNLIIKQGKGLREK